MSPEQVQSLELTNRSDLYSLGAVMYELLTGIASVPRRQPVKLLHQIVYATPPPIHTLRKDVPEELERRRRDGDAEGPGRSATRAAWTSPPSSRACTSACARQNARIDQQEQFGVLRRLKFFHEFSHAEIWEVLRASTWQDYAAGEEIVKEGEMDDRFYILVTGSVHGRAPRQEAGRARDGRLLR